MAHNILLIGGHGKVAQLLTPLLLAKSWNVTSMIRTASQQSAVEKLGQNQPGKLSVLVSSVADVQNEKDAKSILDKVEPDWVVWSAGMFILIFLPFLVPQGNHADLEMNTICRGLLAGLGF
jgi:dTDP-4-dehydrorhamnose reductase